MKTKHTPGPWREGSTAHSKWVEAGAVRICQVDTEEENAGINFYESEANARLIAAAPDLLASLLGILPFIPKSSKSDGGAAMHSPAVAAADAVRSAIVKARGEI